MIRSMRLMSVAVILAVVAFALVGQTPASAQTWTVHCGQGTTRGADVVNGGQVIQTCIPVANNSPARPIVVQSEGYALQVAPVYREKGQVARWGTNPLNPWQWEPIGSFAKGDPVVCADKDVRAWGADQCFGVGSHRPLSGWTWCGYLSCTSVEIEEYQGGFYNLNPLNSNSTAPTYSAPQSLPATGGGVCYRPADGAAGTLIGGNCVVR